MNMDIYIFLSTICCQSIPRSEKGPDMVYGIRYTSNLNPQREVFQTFGKLSGTELWKTVISDSPNSKCGQKQNEGTKNPAGKFFQKNDSWRNIFWRFGGVQILEFEDTQPNLKCQWWSWKSSSYRASVVKCELRASQRSTRESPQKVDSDLMRSIPPSKSILRSSVISNNMQLSSAKAAKVLGLVVIQRQEKHHGCCWSWCPETFKNDLAHRPYYYIP